CDGARPACGFCVRRHIPCVFLGTRQRDNAAVPLVGDLAARFRAEIDRTSAVRASMLIAPPPQPHQEPDADPMDLDPSPF
ncbi:hypothetical protein HK405_013368, partial [Cladochytrium tenue]